MTNPIPGQMVPCLLDALDNEAFRALNAIAYCHITSLRDLCLKARVGHSTIKRVLADLRELRIVTVTHLGNRQEFAILPPGEWRLNGFGVPSQEHFVPHWDQNVPSQEHSTFHQNVPSQERNVPNGERNVPSQERFSTSTYKVPDKVPGSPNSDSNIIQLPGTQGPTRQIPTPRTRKLRGEPLGRWWVRYVTEGADREEQRDRLVEMIEAVFLMDITASEETDLLSMIGAPTATGDVRSAEFVAEHVWEMGDYKKPVRSPVWLTKERCEDHEARKAGLRRKEYKQAQGSGYYGLSPNGMKKL